MGKPQLEIPNSFVKDDKTVLLSMYGCVYFYVVHILNSVTKRSNTQLPEEIDLKTNREGLKRKKIDVNFYLNVLLLFVFVFVCR